MRFSIGFSIPGLVSTGLLTAFSLAAATTGKPAKVVDPVPPKTGIKTPGVQIPFAQLKPEATMETPDKPGWLYFAQAGPASNLYTPAADKVLKFDLRAGAKATDPLTVKAVDPIAVKKPCGGAVSAFASLWVPSCGDGSLLRLDSRSAKVKATIQTGALDMRGSIVASPDSVWLIADNRQTIVRIDPDQDAVVAELRVPPGCGNMIFAETSLWLTCPEQNKVLRINPVTNLIDKRIEVGAKPVALASGQGSIWVLCGKEGKLDRIDPKTDKVAKSIDLSVPDVNGAMAFGEGALWVTMTGFPLTRVDISEVDKERVAQQFWGEGGGGILTSAGALYLSNLNNGTVTRIDPKLVLATLAE
ncbi:MAG: hypothetical protein JWN34_4686 [Bryobacterales bacterium]|nr:hypothetical protein [Bryobacterales bacterium]